MSADPKSNWCHQMTNLPHGCINNSIYIAPSLQSPAIPYLYVSNNDQTIKVYAVGGNIPDYQAAARRRQDKHRQMTISEAEMHTEETRGSARATSTGGLCSDSGADSSSSEAVEEQDTYDLGGPCTLEQIESSTLSFDTAINHTSISRDGRRLVAVGDTNEVWLYDCMANGDYQKVHSFTASDDASFGTDWSATGDKFAVSSQDGFVHVYDIRFLPSPGTSGAGGTSPRPRTIASLKSSQAGPAGAARSVKFSTGSRVSSELLAFTEHRSYVQVVDARTFDQVQLIRIPPSSMYPSVSSAAAAETIVDLPPPPNPRPLPPSRRRRSGYQHQRPSHGSDTASDGSAAGSNGAPGRPFIDGLYAERVRERGSRGLREPPGLSTSHRTSPIRFTALSRSTELDSNEGNSDDDIEMGDERAEIRSPHRSDHQPLRRYAMTPNPFRRYARTGNLERDTPSEVDLGFDDDCPSEETDNHDVVSERDSTSGTDLNAIPPRNDWRWILPDPRERQREEDVRAMRAARSIAAGRTPAPHITRNILSGYAPLPTWVQPSRPSGSLYDDPTAITASSPSWPAYTASSMRPPPPPSDPRWSFNPPGASPVRSSVPNHASSSFIYRNNSNLSGGTSGTTTGYQPNSLYFPLESTPNDLLGLDWDDQGSSLFVATEGRVWEWRVDGQARRSFGAWDLR